MRLQGSREEIEAIEKEIKVSAYCFQHKQRNYDNFFGIPSIVNTKVLDVLPRKEAHLFSVRFFYDNRDGEATIDVSDRNIDWLKKLSPDIAKMVDMLVPERNNNER